MNSTLPTDVFYNFKYSGLGQVRFDNGDSQDVRFEISLLNNGIIIGTLKFIAFDFKTENHIRNDSFVLEGVEERYSSAVAATGCKAIKYSSSTDFTNSSIHESATFTAFELNMMHNNSDTIETDKLVLEFGIMNVHNVPHGASVNTNLGVLELSNYDDIKERQDLMSTYHTPLITSNISLSIDSNTDRKSLDKLVDEGIKIVDDFLKITSFFQTTWHEWVFVIANAVGYDKTNKLLRPLSIRMITPKAKPPYSRKIVDPFSFGTHVNEAMKKYTPLINEHYGYDYALEWYIESNSGNIFETEFLNACTCLELLMGRFHAFNKTEFIIDDNNFRHFYDEMKKYASKLLTKAGVDPKSRSSIYTSMKNMQRRSFVDKAETMLKYWRIEYSDLEVTLKDIVKIRNDVTHKGKYYGPQGLDELTQIYNGLFNILTRVFLALLGFKGEYYDAPNSRWIKFEEVCAQNTEPNKPVITDAPISFCFQNRQNFREFYLQILRFITRKK